MKKNAIQVFEGQRVRTAWDDKQEKWFFSIVDTIAVLTGSPNARKYWSVLKIRLKKEGSELTTNCSQLKMLSADGKWDKRGVQKGQEYAILTDIITKGWSGLDTRDYKKLKDLKTENLRDNMTNLELVLNMLAEATTTEISKTRQPKNFHQNKTVAQEGGQIAGNTRREIEEKTGKKIVSGKNFKSLKSADKKKLN